ncbi:MAG: hypothetical protein KF760_21070 [Candidatus Eremiobacteraeota bacterium]|nr:hypothetical protein [Candidatus Eremiobacteraeota bacterium]MCW5867312.1 hypothetical protein [Candidatus Eremiobacteraeota bacterium]
MRLWLLILVSWLCLVWPGLAQEQPPEQKCSDNLQLLLSSLTRYGKDHQNRFPDKLEELVPRYLSELPKCPLGGPSYTRYSAVEHDPERAVLICSYPAHAIKPPDYLVLSSDRGIESPFAHVSDPSICRRSLVQLLQNVEQQRSKINRYPERLHPESMCSCGDPIQYQPLQEGKSFIAYCPGAAHLGSGLAPFSPSIGPGGLQERSLLLPPPSSAPPHSKGLSGTALAAGGMALAILLGLGVSAMMRRRRVRLD